MKNQDIRAYCKKKHVFLWQCASALGISEPTMTRRLRTELSEKDKQHFISIIDKLAEQSDQNTAKETV